MSGGTGSGKRRPEPAAARALEAAFERVLFLSRGLALIPVVVLSLSALGAFAYGTAVFVDSVAKVVAHPFPVGNKIGLFLLVIDLFLIGGTLLIAAVGFYELFISQVDPDAAWQLPGWLKMADLNDLKARVIAMVVLVAAVSFVEAVVDFADSRVILEAGGGVALVVVALTGFLRYGGSERGGRG